MSDAKGRLVDALEALHARAPISFHMPGHKNGQLQNANWAPSWADDITEIDGMDHLHNASGCILATECALSAHYGSERTRMLVGGSTVGLMAALFALLPRGGTVVMNRNAHQSVYNAVHMREAKAYYLFPKIDATLGIPVALEAEVSQFPADTSVCVLTYPTYEGIPVDIAPIIAGCRERGIPVLVDEAHGAHLHLFSEGPVSALDLGADLVVQSFHKTLPAMTQTACIHISKGARLTEGQRRRLDWHLSALQTSSPSYVLMASVDHMLTVLERSGRADADMLTQRVEAYYRRVEGLGRYRHIRYPGQDIGKLLIHVPNGSAKVLNRQLRCRFNIYSEYATDRYILLMASICSSNRDFEALAEALETLETLEALDAGSDEPMTWAPFTPLPVPERVCSPHWMFMQALKTVSREDAVGCISGAYCIPYPPGIPILVPGERISSALIKYLPQQVEILMQDRV